MYQNQEVNFCNLIPHTFPHFIETTCFDGYTIDQTQESLNTSTSGTGVKDFRSVTDGTTTQFISEPKTSRQTTDIAEDTLNYVLRFGPTHSCYFTIDKYQNLITKLTIIQKRDAVLRALLKNDDCTFLNKDENPIQNQTEDHTESQSGCSPRKEIEINLLPKNCLT